METGRKKIIGRFPKIIKALYFLTKTISDFQQIFFFEKFLFGQKQMSGCDSMSNNYGGGYNTQISVPNNGGGYYNSQNNEVVKMLGAANPGCYFPGPPPKRVYCDPAPFVNPLGLNYQRLVDAYGMSRPHY